MNAFLHRWHRRVGIFVACLVVLLAITGIALVYDEVLDLDRRYITQPAMLDWYAIRPPPPPLAYAVTGGWVTQVGPRLYRDRRLVSDRVKTFLGAVLIDDTTVVALDGELWFLALDGEVRDKLTALDGVPQPLLAVGTGNAHTLVLRAGAGTYGLALDTLAISAQKFSKVTWAVPADPPLALQKFFADAYRGRQLTWERVVLDLHSGRILGAVGAGVVSLSAVLMIFLAASGMLTWWRRQCRVHRHSRNKT